MDEDILVVSGLPRSGTSMMMRMLEAGGVEVVVDHIRTADIDNPRGYYELEKVKQIKQDTSWLSQTRGKAFKMVSLLLFHLPPEYRYKILFMRRAMPEMLASQRKMLERMGKQGGSGNDDAMGNLFTRHLQEIEGWLHRQSNMSVLYMPYNDVVQQPRPQVEKIAHWLGRPLDLDRMAGIVDPALYRQKTT